MANKTTIQVNEPPASLPGRHLRNGKMYLDLGPFELQLNKSVQELTQTNDIPAETAFGGALPYSPVNDHLLKKYRNANVPIESYTPESVTVINGAHTFRLDQLAVLNASDEARQYEIELKRTNEDWRKKADQLFLKDILLGTYDLTEANLRAAWNTPQYLDGTTGVYFPLCNYGAFYDQSTVITEDFRAWFHPLYLLQKGFQQIGWNFRCPALETPYGRQLIAYLLSPNYGSDGQANENRIFRAQLIGPQIFTPTIGDTIVFFAFETVDPGNNYDNTTYTYSGTGFFNFTVKVNGTMGGFINQGTVYLQLIRVDAQGVETAVKTEVSAPTDANQPFTIELNATDVLVSPGQSIFVRAIPGPNTPTYSLASGSFENTVIRSIIGEGETFVLNETLHPDLTLYDLFKGIAHPFKGKARTYWNSRETWLYTPYEVDLYSTNIEGFYLDTAEDLTPRVHSKTLQVNNPPVEQKRYVRIGFAKPSDNYIKIHSPDAVPFDKEVDLGTNYLPGKPEESRNPIFEPTLNGLATTIPTSTGTPVDVPHLWDNDDNKPSFDLGFRIAFTPGFIQQVNSEAGAANTLRTWLYKGTEETFTPYAFQVPLSQQLNGIITEDITERVVYGDEENDFWRLFWFKDFLDEKNAIRHTFTLHTKNNDYKREDFRGLKVIDYGGRTQAFRAIAIDSFEPAKQQSLMVFRRVTTGSASTVVGQVCMNQAGIQVTGDFNKGEALATAIDTGINSAINTDQWEYSTDNGNTWNPYTPGAVISGSYILFRRTVSFTDGCPDSVVSSHWSQSAQCANTPTIDINYNNGNNTASATGGGTFNSTILTDVWTVDIDGAGPVAYVPGTQLNGFMELIFRRQLSYDNICPASDITNTITVVPPQCFNQPQAEFTVVDGCIYTAVMSGTVTSVIAQTSWQISRDGGATYVNWDGQPIVSEPDTRLKALVHYCDTCPPTCLEYDCSQIIETP